VPVLLVVWEGWWEACEAIGGCCVAMMLPFVAKVHRFSWGIFTMTIVLQRHTQHTHSARNRRFIGFK